MRIHDTVQVVLLPSDFVAKFNEMRTKRNRISHSIDNNLQVHTAEVLETILFFHNALFPSQSWAKIRAAFLRRYPDTALNSGEFARNKVCRELEGVVELLPPSAVEKYFGISKRQYLYLCPVCMHEASREYEDFGVKLAALRPKGPSSTQIYCPVCDAEYEVVRCPCGNGDCPGNVIGAGEEPYCLTCGEWKEIDAET